MNEQFLSIADNFWNIRGDFKIGGVVNIGTHASLIRCVDGKYVMLDAYTLSGSVKSRVDELTNQGRDLKAILNLHPFHTIHVEKAHKQYPSALLYGTKRHLERFPKLTWQPELCDSAEFADVFASDLEFSVPAGVDFISSNEQIHFSSVLAYHPSSKTLHVDDTLMYMKFPGILGWLMKPEVKFHLTLAAALQKRRGAADEFLNWATQMVTQWSDIENLCAAHSAVVQSSSANRDSIANQILNALEKVGPTLKKHKTKYG